MKLLLITLTILFVILDTLDVSQACSNCHNSSHHYKRRKRDADSDAAFKLARDFLSNFDEELKAKLQPELEQLSPEDRNKFEGDLQGINIAAEAVFSSIVSEEGTKLSPKELVQTVVARVMEDFENSSWLIRIREFSGKKLENTVQEFIDKMDN